MPLGDWVARTTERTAAFIRTPNGHLLIGAGASAIATATVILGIQETRRRRNRRHLRDIVEDEIDRLKTQAENDLTGFGTPRGHGPAIEDGGGIGAGPSEEETESLIGEQLARNIAFLGEEGNRKVRNAFVIVVGMGGVGSAAATMLVRSGVGRIRLIDFDQVTLSSLNVRARSSVSFVSTLTFRYGTLISTATCDGNTARRRSAQGRRCEDVLSEGCTLGQS
jgi:tRNA threonylcarbamoyladenosine dehydratase